MARRRRATAGTARASALDAIRHDSADDGPLVRVVIADQDPLRRFGLRRALEDQAFSVCAEADDASGTVRAALRERPDICLLELRIPGDAIAATQTITTESPRTNVVALITSRDDPELFDALCAGASGYLSREAGPERIPAILRDVLRGEIALPRAIVARLVGEHSRGEALLAVLRDRGVQLTHREWEVLKLLREGLTTADIARRLFISQVTVRSHISSVFKKLAVRDRRSVLRLLDEQQR